MRGKWTPGPWHLKGGNTPGFRTHSGQPGVYAAARPTDDFFILQIAEMATNVPERERQANVRLIAACPTMADVLDAAPIISAYHTAKGFEVERFLTDYEAWSATKRAALSLAHTEPSQGEK